MQVSTSQSIPGMAIMHTGPFADLITDTGGTITSQTGGTLQGTATVVTGITDVTGITGVTAISTIRGRPTPFTQQKTDQRNSDPSPNKKAAPKDRPVILCWLA